MGRLIDLTGQRFGKLTVLERGEDQINPSGKKRVRWKCQCDCGNIVLVVGESLRSGASNSCGCGRKEANQNNAKKKDEQFLNTTFGDLTPIKRVNDRGTNAAYLCKCTCGNKVVALRSDLENGKKTHCGCKNPERHNYKDITGHRFGKLVALYPTKPNSRRSMQWMFQCDCGQQKEIEGTSVTRGNTLSCGCLKMSHGELKISQLLDEANIPYVREKYMFDFDKEGKSKARFDFFVEDRYLIEFDGEQHFSANNRWWNTEHYVSEQQDRDRIKDIWCKENNIPLIRIPYTHLDNLILDDLRLDTSAYLLD